MSEHDNPEESVEYSQWLAAYEANIIEMSPSAPVVFLKAGEKKKSEEKIQKQETSINNLIIFIIKYPPLLISLLILLATHLRNQHSIRQTVNKSIRIITKNQKPIKLHIIFKTNIINFNQKPIKLKTIKLFFFFNHFLFSSDF